MKKRILAVVMAATMLFALSACGNGAAPTAGGSGGNIKVGIINCDPNESGYRTANDKDLKAMFTEENGYDATFAYGDTNDKQISAAQQMI